jgi:two-component system, cell cycle response regulator DivK
MSEAPRVLVVDDNPLNVELAAAVLSADGMQVEVAADAAETALRMAEFKPELVLMDIQLPGVDGLTLTRQIKADPATRHVVVLAFTAYAMKGDEARMLDAGCDGYISKPIEVGSFAAQVRRWLRQAG